MVASVVRKALPLLEPDRSANQVVGEIDAGFRPVERISAIGSPVILSLLVVTRHAAEFNRVGADHLTEVVERLEGVFDDPAYTPSATNSKSVKAE